MAPHLFQSVIADVPFTDVIVTMLDETIPWTSYEFAEWGNAKVRENFECMKLYCPITNLKKHVYPHMLVTAGLNDPRVQYW
jgi:oligopeptidase B